jgi:hypothetical protein
MIENQLPSNCGENDPFHFECVICTDGDFNSVTITFVKPEEPTSDDSWLSE